MAFPQEVCERFCKEVTLLIGDATRDIVAAKAARKMYVTYAQYVPLVANAASVSIQSVDTTVNVLKVPANQALGVEVWMGPLFAGIELGAGQKLVVVPSAAGPGGHVIVEGYFI